MKKLFLLFILVSFTGFSQPLSGNYIIGASQPTPFNTLTNAVNRINASGVSGPVVFLLNDANYNTTTGEVFPINIGQFAGNSSTNTLTIKPNAGKTVIVRADNINSYTSTQAVIKFNGADNVIINGSNNGSSSKDLTIVNNNSLEYSKKAVIWFANESNTNGASNNTVSNVYLRQQTIKGDLSIGVYAGGTAVDATTAPTSNSNNVIRNVTFSKVGQGIYVTGSAASGSQSENWTITNSVFGATADDDKAFLGIYLNNIKNYTISNNTIDGILKNTTNYNPLHAAIYTDGNASNGKIFNNKITNVRETTGSAGSTGILLNGNNTIVYNNFISNVRAKGNGGNLNNGYGILINSGQSVMVYHNSIRLVDNQDSGFSAALYINNGSVLSIVNNIFVNSQTSGAARYAVYAAVSASAFDKIDYNDYYSTQNLGYLSGNTAALTNWKTATGQDVNSVNLLPVFTSATDLHLTESNLALDNLGTPLTVVTTDIDGTTRNMLKPDLGAAEFEAAKCAGTTIWNGSNWSNGVPTKNTKAIFNGDYSTTMGNVSACEIAVSTGKTITINTGQYIEVQNDAAISGNIVVENGGSFLQVREDSSNTLASGGKFTMKRTTSPIRKFDFVYWSSPVQGQTLYNLSPDTRFDKYYKYDPAVGNWVTINNGTETMEVGKGYIARAPNEFSETVAAPFATAFVGKPNNGPINVALVKSAVDNTNLIGNPYPSAIDAKLFLNDAANVNIIGGTVYLWTHVTAISQVQGTNTYGYASDDYAAYNKIGGVKTNATGTVFQGKIAAGQSFFVEALASGTAVFKNSMRLKSDNQQFYKQAVDPSINNDADNRFWLNLTNDQGAFKQILLGFANGATDGYDQQYDGLMLNGNSYVNFYSVVDQKNLVIQGRGLPFSDSQVIALGFSAQVAGSYTITLDGFDGLFNNQAIYLIDKLTHTVQNLKDAAYTFNTTTGTFNDRFEVRFVNGTLSTQNPMAVANETIVIAQNQEVHIKSDSTLKSLAIYDLNGKLLYSKQHIETLTFNTGKLNIHSQIILVSIENNLGTVTKKLIL